MTAELSSLERLLRRDRQIVVVALVSVTALAWIYTLFGVGLGVNALDMSHMTSIGGIRRDTSIPLSSMSYFLVMLAMWWIMMVAMMLPSATPIILLAATLNRRSTSNRPPYGTATFFTIGYLFAWFFFSGLVRAGVYCKEQLEAYIGRVRQGGTLE